MSKADGVSEQEQDRFVNHIASLSPGAKAALRRSLAFKPGSWPGAFPYVEAWVTGSSVWERQVTYLVAGLQALSRAERTYPDLGAATKALQEASGSASVEARFLALLEADEEQLPHRLRQLVSLLNSRGLAPEWGRLRRDLRRWRSEEKWVQQRWARSFYAATPAGEAEAGAEAAESGEATSE